MIVLSCFDKSTVMVQPWARAGYKCYCVDIQHEEDEPEKNNIIKVKANMLNWIPPREKIAFCFLFFLLVQI